MQKNIISNVEKVAKEGKKTFYTIHFQDDSKATTFDSKIELAIAGDTLEWEPIVSGKYVNIKDGFILTKHTSPSPTREGSGNGGMTPETWAEKDRLEQWSRECNTCFMGIADLLKIDHEFIDGGKQKEVHDAALDWALAHLKGVTTPPAKQALKPDIVQAKKDSKELWPGEQETSQPVKEPQAGLDFDPDTLLDQLKQVHWKDNTVKSYLKNVYQVDTEGTVVEVVARLNREQREAFFKEIQDRLEMR